MDYQHLVNVLYKTQHRQGPVKPKTKREFKMPSKKILKTTTALLLAGSIIAGVSTAPVQAAHHETNTVETTQTQHKTIEIDGLDIFYREAGPKDAPVILLLHGFPTSSQMFAQLMRDLGDEYHLIAPDYPGFGNSSMPLVDEFDYSFDNLANIVDKFIAAKGLDKYAIYLMDYGAPVGYRIATRHPEKVTGLIVQNGNAYVEGLREFWDPIRAYWAERSDSENVSLGNSK